MILSECAALPADPAAGSAEGRFGAPALGQQETFRSQGTGFAASDKKHANNMGVPPALPGWQ
jgi:hypothetical protein